MCIRVPDQTQFPNTLVGEDDSWMYIHFGFAFMFK